MIILDNFPGQSLLPDRMIFGARPKRGGGGSEWFCSLGVNFYCAKEFGEFKKLGVDYAIRLKTPDGEVELPARVAGVDRMEKNVVVHFEGETDVEIYGVIDTRLDGLYGLYSHTLLATGL